MSVNRENVTWQSEDGTWNRAFYDFFDVDTDKEDWDFEWDVEYDYSSFNWVSTGHSTPEAADESWHGANPGGGIHVPYTPENAEQIARYEQMAQAYLEQERQRQEEIRQRARQSGPSW